MFRKLLLVAWFVRLTYTKFIFKQMGLMMKYNTYDILDHQAADFMLDDNRMMSLRQLSTDMSIDVV